MTVAVFTGTLHSTFIFSFSLASSMSCSAVAGPHMGSCSHTGRAFVILNRCVWKQCCYLPTLLQPLSCPAFSFNTAQKQVPLICRLKIVHWWTKLTLPPLFSCPLSPFFLPSYLTVWNTTLCEFRKNHRYPSPDFLICMANGLLWMVLKLNVSTGSCMCGNADL